MADPMALPTVMPDLASQSVLITGGASGIGRCLVLSFAKAGAFVVFADTSATASDETLALARELGIAEHIHFIQADLARPVERDDLVRKTLDLTNGRLNVLINNAAIADAHFAHLFSADPDDFDRILAVNLTAPFHLTRLLVDALAAPAGETRGAVINLASTRAFQSEPDSEGYAASKGGIVALTHAMAVSLSSRMIRVNAIAPGWIDTSAWQPGNPEPIKWDDAEHRQHPSGRIGQPADIAAACLYLAGPDAGFITGQTLVIDGGMTRKMIYR